MLGLFSDSDEQTKNVDSPLINKSGHSGLALIACLRGFLISRDQRHLSQNFVGGIPQGLQGSEIYEIVLTGTLG